MSTPGGDNAFLYELELDVRTELTLAETGQGQLEEAADVAIDEWLPDTDAERYEIRLRTLLGAVESLEVGAVESLEDGPGPGKGGE